MTQELEPVDAEYRELAERPTEPVTLFGTDDPDAVIDKAARVATALAKVVHDKNLSVRIGQSDYVKVEGWTCLGSLVGVFPRTVWTKQLENGWEARVEAVTRDGTVIGAAEASCTSEERNWKGRDDFALRSMAQTRAMGKALRMPLGFIAVLAGYEATPAEEMPAPTSQGGLRVPATVTTEAGEFRFPTGKHSGKTLAEAPSAYLDWYSENGPRQDVKDAIATYRAGGDAQASLEDEPAFPPVDDQDDIPF